MTAHARKTPGSNVASPKTAGAASFILNVDTPAGTIAVTVTRKRVRNLNLRVRGDGSVVASIPLHTSAARAQAFLDRRASWIAQHVLRHREQAELERDAAHAPSTIPLWGELVSSEKAFGSALSPESAAAEAEDLVAELYRQEVKRALPAVAEHLEHQMGVHASRWQVRVMKTRWGSCTPRTSSATSWNRATTSAFIRCSISTAPKTAQSPPCSKSPREPQRVRRHRLRGSTHLRRDACTRNETIARQRDGRSQQLKPGAPWLLHRDYWLLAASPKTYRLEARISFSMQLIYLREY